MQYLKLISLFVFFITLKALALEVAVVGAGSSGLSAAHYLKKQGHSVTIFEKNDRVGGKVYSYKIDGITIELGGLIIPKGFDTINELVQIYGVQLVTFPSKVLFLDEDNDWQKFKGYSAIGPVKTLIQYKRLKKIYKRFPELSTPQLVYYMHPDLFLPLDKFAKRYGFYEVLPPFVMSMSASGYLYPEVTPAYYALKLFKTIAAVGINAYIDKLNPFSSPYIKGLRTIKNGYSELWENIASHFDVRLNEEVLSIGEGELNTTKGKYHFDKVIVSTDIQTARSIIMKPSKELSIFADGLSSQRFLVSVIKTNDLPGKKRHSFFFYPNMTVSRFNHVVSMVNFWNSDELFVTYQNLDGSTSWQEAKDILADDLNTTLKVKNFEIIKQVEWPYFHHVPTYGFTEEMSLALKKLQGQNGIYFVGESLHFETTESAAQNAKWVVEKYF